MAMGIAKQLRRLGYEVPKHASTAEAAIQRDQDENPDCMLMVTKAIEASLAGSRPG
jgi:hypothetical protein